MPCNRGRVKYGHRKKIMNIEGERSRGGSGHRRTRYRIKQPKPREFGQWVERVKSE